MGLSDLTCLQDSVRNSDTIVPLLTPGFLYRPWCLIELVVARRHNIEVVPVEIQRPGMKFEYPDDAWYDSLRNGTCLDEACLNCLEACGITLADVEATVRRVFLKI